MLIIGRLKEGKRAKEEEQETILKLMRLTNSDANEQRKTSVIAIETGRQCQAAAMEGKQGQAPAFSESMVLQVWSPDLPISLPWAFTDMRILKHHAPPPGNQTLWRQGPTICLLTRLLLPPLHPLQPNPQCLPPVIRTSAGDH